MPDLSIVIPTYRRVDALERTLRALGAQQLDGSGIETIVVDNDPEGRDHTELQALARAQPIQTRVVVERNRGPAAARNRGIPLAQAELVMFLGDDTPPANDRFLAGHLAAHRAGDADRAVIGPSCWHPSLPITPVMEWLHRSGIYFNYDLMEAGQLGPAVFYTNNVSLPKRALEAVDGFDERFPDAACEDYDLGLRLFDQGLRLEFHRELVVYHDHYYDLEISKRRMWTVGKAANVVRRVHPRRAVQTPHPPSFKVAIARVVAPLIDQVPVPEQRLRGSLRDRVYQVVHRAALARGYIAGRTVPVEVGLRGGLRTASGS